MFVHYQKDRQRVPIKIWLDRLEDVEPGCLQQALNLANLPFVYKWVALMPDTHQGYGMPIGGVIAAEDVIIPNAVGVDIGCGMAFVETNIHKSQLEYHDYSNLVGQIMRAVPTGFEHHKKPHPCETMDNDEWARQVRDTNFTELPNIEEGYFQIGTLGSGNHFIELQEDEAGMLCIMVHSGSRNFGFKVCHYFNKLAKHLSQNWSVEVPPSYDLAFLPVSSPEGQEYIRWMNLALRFARENRQVMLEVVKQELTRRLPSIEFGREVNAHHNYAALENHYDKEVWVHRKGAIRAQAGELGIIPGAMGSYSYIVQGRGNPESFMSCSHGAGRKMSRHEAMRKFSVQETVEDLQTLGVAFGKRNKKDCSDEARWAYKDIDEVIRNELDLVVPIMKLKTLAVVKG
jgi:tRNA-splicing ligase RtcB (3'-phosphate/5'-hydroxy nucleic acid ligase)